MKEGWFKIQRKFCDGSLWLSEPFSRSQAWIDLIYLANYEYSFFYKRNIKIEVQRGQVARSEVELSDRWKWSRSKVRKFINDLEKEHQVEQHKTNVTQLLTVINYDLYQSKEQQDEQQENSNKTSEKHQKDILKENKEVKVKKEKKVSSQKTFVPPILDDVKLYFKENGYTEASAIKSFNYYNVADWFDSNGKKVSSWKQKMQSVWFKDENKDQSLQPKQKPKLST